MHCVCFWFIFGVSFHCLPWFEKFIVFFPWCIPTCGYSYDLHMFVVFIKSGDGIIQVYIAEALVKVSYAEDRQACYHTRRGCLVCWGWLFGLSRFGKL